MDLPLLQDGFRAMFVTGIIHIFHRDWIDCSSAFPTVLCLYCYLIQNSQAVKKVCGPQKGYGEKRCEIQGGGQEMAVMVG